MRKYKLTDWQDYWKIFEELIELLSTDKKLEIIAELNDAQKHVNGLTYGWYEFKFSLEKTLDKHTQNMNAEQNYIANFLIDTLNQSLKNRG